MRKTLGELDATAGQSAIQCRELWARALTPNRGGAGGARDVGGSPASRNGRRKRCFARSRLAAAPAAAEATDSINHNAAIHSPPARKRAEQRDARAAAH